MTEAETVDDAARETAVDRRFLDLLRLCTGLGLHVTDDPAAPNYAPRVFAVLGALLPDPLPDIKAMLIKGETCP